MFACTYNILFFWLARKRVFALPIRHTNESDITTKKLAEQMPLYTVSNIDACYEK